MSRFDVTLLHPELDPLRVTLAVGNPLSGGVSLGGHVFVVPVDAAMSHDSGLAAEVKLWAGEPYQGMLNEIADTRTLDGLPAELSVGEVETGELYDVYRPDGDVFDPRFWLVNTDECADVAGVRDAYESVLNHQLSFAVETEEFDSALVLPLLGDGLGADACAVAVASAVRAQYAAAERLQTDTPGQDVESLGFGTLLLIHSDRRLVEALNTEFVKLAAEMMVAKKAAEKDADAAMEEMFKSDYERYTSVPEETVKDTCSVCLGEFGALGSPEGAVQITKCRHQFHEECIKSYMSSSARSCCPLCRVYYAFPRGNMPDKAKMSHVIIDGPLPGFESESTQTYMITYDIRSGVQTLMHPNPGVRFEGTHRTAYLPVTERGTKVLRLLEKAFECRLTFTVGRSLTTGCDNVVVWAGIHHKTSIYGGTDMFGYPDRTYLDRVLEELRLAGIVDEMLDGQ